MPPTLKAYAKAHHTIASMISMGRFSESEGNTNIGGIVDVNNLSGVIHIA